MHTITLTIIDNLNGSKLFSVQKAVRKNTPAARCALLNETLASIKAQGFAVSSLRHVFD